MQKNLNSLKRSVLFLIALTVAGIAATYYSQHLHFSGQEFESQYSAEVIAERIEYTKGAPADLAELFLAQNELIVSKNATIEQSLSFQKVFGWAILVLLAFVLFDLIRIGKALTTDET